MKTKTSVFLGIVFIIIVSLTMSPGCTEETETEITPTTPTEPETVAFLDENLEPAIREHLGKRTGEEITAEELATLTSFEASGRGITNLTGLEYCSNLTELHLFDNQVSALSPLSSLTNLTILNLDKNQVGDLSPLASLTSLTWLGFWNNREISDLSPLSDLTNLDYLQLGGNQISDISPLVQNIGLGSGDIVYLSDNPLSDDSLEVYIPQLEERGVEINWGCPP